MSGTGFRAGGYSLVLPPGWVRVPLNGASDGTLERTLERAVAGALPAELPRDERARATVRIMGRLRAVAAEARESGALDLYLPIRGMHGLAIPASFLVHEVPVPAGEDERAALAELVAAGGAEVVVDGASGVRQDATLPADPLMSETGTPTRRISYVLPAPGAGRWLSVVYSTFADGDAASEFAEVLVDLFDAIMTTFRWNAAAR